MIYILRVRSLKDTYQDINLKRGVKKSLIADVSNKFYKRNATTFPYNSVRTLLKSLKWPHSYRYLYNYPKDREYLLSDECQGVTHDDQNWFFTQKSWLWKIPVTEDLNAPLLKSKLRERNIIRRGIPAELRSQGYDHFGDLDYYRGRLFVPVEHENKKENPPKVAVFDSQTLRYIFSADLNGHDGHAPWCAINPLNGLLYTSSAYLTSVRGDIHVYEIVRYDELRSIFKLNYLGQLITYDETGKKINTNGVQGGVFSKTGHLYLSIWRTLVIPPPEGTGYEVSEEASEQGGIWGFDIITGVRIRKEEVEYNAYFPKYEELEGITIWDVDTLRPPSISGQIHLVMLDNDINEGDLYFKHFSVGGQKDII